MPSMQKNLLFQLNGPRLGWPLPSSGVSLEILGMKLVLRTLEICAVRWTVVFTGKHRLESLIKSDFVIITALETLIVVVFVL